MNIQFIETKVKSLDFRKMSKTSWTDENNMQFSFTQLFDDSNLREFSIVFNVSLQLEDEYILTVEYMARFSTDDEIDEKFKTSHFVKGNAPAIAYPYLRAYIGNLTLNSGFAPAVLPTVNFTQYLSK